MRNINDTTDTRNSIMDKCNLLHTQIMDEMLNCFGLRFHDHVYNSIQLNIDSNIPIENITSNTLYKQTLNNRNIS